VVRAGSPDDISARRALGELLQSYWQPLYVFGRRSGLSSADADDAVQEFCALVVRRETLQAADPARGRLRTFLLTAFRNHLRNAHRDRQRERRGGGTEIVHLDTDKTALESALGDTLSPDAAFERRWVLTLLERVLTRLRAEYEERRRGAIFAKLEPLLSWGGGEASYAEIAASLGLTEAAVQQAVKRMRLRYRALLEEEISQTVDGAAAVAEERDYLIRVLSK
jgi:RNA polymerase sigma-70 factor (ECF subfamily)